MAAAGRDTCEGSEAGHADDSVIERVRGPKSEVRSPNAGGYTRQPGTRDGPDRADCMQLFLALRHYIGRW